MRFAYVYELTEPGSHTRRYVGCTTNPELRMRQHLAGKCASTRAWIGELHAMGKAPVMRIKRTMPERIAFRVEAAWIRYAHRKGEAVLNHRPQGKACPWPS